MICPAGCASWLYYGDAVRTIVVTPFDTLLLLVVLPFGSWRTISISGGCRHALSCFRMHLLCSIKIPISHIAGGGGQASE